MIGLSVLLLPTLRTRRRTDGGEGSVAIVQARPSSSRARDFAAGEENYTAATAMTAASIDTACTHPAHSHRHANTVR